jgi:glycosyltransferase involved in cell wall biosynthesis
MYHRSKLIFTTTQQTKNLISKCYWHKTFIETNIGVEVTDQQKPEDSKNSTTNLLFVGRFIYWKGITLLIEALGLVTEKLPNVKMALVGEGADLERLKNLITKKSLEKNTKIILWLEQSELKKYYQESDIFVFPSLHDSSGNVLLEAMSNGLPIICFDNAGPGFIVDETSGLKIDLNNKSANTIIEELAESITKLANDTELRQKLSQGALERVKEFTWENLYKNVYSRL